jgi:hypothetical protein
MYLRFLSILEKKEKKLLYLLLIFSIIVFFLESLSFGILIPFIKYLFTGNSNFFEKIIQLLKINNYQFNIFLFSFIFLLFVVKNLLLYIYALLIYSFTFSLKENVSKKFYTLYLEADYISNLSTTISKKITLLSEVNNFINAINSVLNLLSEFFLIIIIALLLFYIDASQNNNAWLIFYI